MAYIEIKDFSNGLDRRRLNVSTPTNALLECRNAFINRGGDIEKRRAFVPVYDLAGLNTVGLQATDLGLFSFGKDAAPVMPAGVGYLRLQHPGTPSLEVQRILDTTLFDDLPYTVAEFENGDVYHYYNGTVVDGVADNRATVEFSITSATPIAGAAPRFTFSILDGPSVWGRLTVIRVNGVSIMSGPTSAPSTSRTDIAQKAVARINDLTSVTGWSASNVLDTVTVTRSEQTSSFNGQNVQYGAELLNLSLGKTVVGGIDPSAAVISSITIAGLELLQNPVGYVSSTSAFMSAVAAAINNRTTSPNYLGQASGNSIRIIAEVPGTAANGRALAVTRANMTLTGADGQSLAGGVDAAESLVQGARTVATYDEKIYAIKGSLLRFSARKAPTNFEDTANGAGFVNINNQTIGRTDYRAVVPYFGSAAIFGERAIQIWDLVADPAGNSRQQIIPNTGAIARNSVVNFGDADVFYLDQSGVRSLRARESVNLSSTSDIGTFVDTLVKEKLRTLTDLEVDKIIGIVEPNDGQFWLVMRDVIFVYSFYSETRISAWGVFFPGFIVEGVAEQDQTLYLRGDDDKVYAYGGLDGQTYDDSEVYVQTPWLDGEDPGREKDFSGLDVIDVENQWDIGFATNVEQQGVFERAVTVHRSTASQDKVAFDARGTHISLSFTCNKPGPARLSSVLVHYSEGTAT